MESSVVEDGKILETRFVHIGDMQVTHTVKVFRIPDQKLIDHQGIKCETCGENINDQGLLPKRDYIEYHKLFCGQKKEELK